MIAQVIAYKGGKRAFVSVGPLGITRRSSLLSREKLSTWDSILRASPSMSSQSEAAALMKRVLGRGFLLLSRDDVGEIEAAVRERLARESRVNDVE